MIFFLYFHKRQILLIIILIVFGRDHNVKNNLGNIRNSMFKFEMPAIDCTFVLMILENVENIYELNLVVLIRVLVEKVETLAFI